jgi:hypothetical protein
LLCGGAVLELEACGALETVLAVVDDTSKGALSGDVVGDGFFVEIEGTGIVVEYGGGDAVGLAFGSVEAIVDEGDTGCGIAIDRGFESACVIVAVGGGDAAFPCAGAQTACFGVGVVGIMLFCL